MAERRVLLVVLSLVCVAIYLFVSAPPPLEEARSADARVPVQEMFAALEDGNDAVRALWTQDIVGAGAQVGLKFDEHWRDADVAAGPLPALFLRETARSLERNPVRLSLFLGSDYPINDANRFEGQQLERLGELRRTGEAQFFYMADLDLHAAMFSDVAVAVPCVDCHNQHEQTPKSDWRLNDVMGATTWLYPAAEVTLEEFLGAVTALHQGFEEAYRSYLEKVATFPDPPPVGARWPREGYFLPSAEVFMAEARRRTAPATLAALEAAARHGGKRSAGSSDAVEP